MKKFLVFSLMLGLVSPLLTFAQTDQTAETSVSTTSAVVAAYNGTCASNAVIAHENNQQTIIEARQASMKVAAVARRDALGVAYLLTDVASRNKAIKNAHNDFLNAQKIADKTAMNAAKAENESFRNTMKGCGAILPPQTRDQMNNQNGFENNGSQISSSSGVKKGLNQNISQFRVLKQGLRGEDVKNIQKILGLKMDGVFGSGTMAKVKEWQARRGLKADGILGKESLKEIEKVDSDVNTVDSNDSANTSGN